LNLAEYATKGEFSSDIELIIYSNPFRRLANKSQIIIKPIGDHFRSRLIHTQEVKQIAHSIGKQLDLNLELIEAIALSHDLGHTPFGHAGERTLRELLKREIDTKFKISYPKEKNEKKKIEKMIFHHSLNSVRILMKEPEFRDINKLIIFGVQNHSWSPWQKTSDYDIPTNYESQVVAISDQLASINHDIEDIIEGYKYAEYTYPRFRKKYPQSYSKIKYDISNFMESKEIKVGYGRRERVEMAVSDIVNNTKEYLKNNNVTSSHQALEYPLKLSENWSNFLSYYEMFIRNIITDKVSWFIGRDNMAGALISTVFNYLWPRARTSGESLQMSLTMYDKKIPSIYKSEEKESYLDHFTRFFKEHYYDEQNNEDHYSVYLNSLKNTEIMTWDYCIYNKLKKRPTGINYKKYIRLLAIIDFISGLTDKYCLEIFDNVYHDFVLS